MGELGELLKQTRESKSLSLAEAEESTRIRQRFLKALEEEDFEELPDEVCARGFLRNYANYLGLDPQQVVSMHAGQRNRTDGSGLSFGRPQTDFSEFQWMELSMQPTLDIFSFDLLIGVVVLVGLVIFGGWWAYNQYVTPLLEATPEQATAAGIPTATDVTDWVLAPTSTPIPTFTPTPTITPTPPFYTGVTIELIIHERSWVQVIVDDVKRFEGTLESGDRRNWAGDDHVVVRCGNAGGVEVVVNGKSQGMLGEQGQVIDREWRKVSSPDGQPQPAAVEETPTATPPAEEKAPASTPEGQNSPPPPSDNPNPSQ